MKLVWWLARPFVTGILNLIPGAPDPVTLTLPWPQAVPSWPFLVSVVTVVAAGSAFLLLRLLRWGYGLIPFLQ